MTIVSLKNFGGRAPRIDPQQLPPEGAQVATNSKTWRGILAPFRATSVVTGMTRAGTVRSIYRYGQNAGESLYWWGFTTDVNVVRGPVAGDTTERTYYTGDGVPKVTDATLNASGPPYPGAFYQLGVPAPGTVASVAVTGTPSANPIKETRLYTYTFVSSWGEEGAPAGPSNVVDVQTGQTVTISALAGNPGGQRSINRKRLYRSTVGASGATTYQLCQVRLPDNSVVYDIPIGTTSVTDVSTSATLGEVLETIDFDEPPTNLFGLVAMPNGFMAGLTPGKEVCFSEPFQPHAWPSKYKQAVEFDPVAIGVFGTSAVVLTKGNPYILSGSDPASMSMQKVELRQACVSKRSMVETGDMVIYASPDGLVAVGPNGVQVITESIISRDDWKALKPDSILGLWHERRYYGFYDTGTVTGGFVLDVANKQLYDIGVYATAGFSDLISDELFLQVGNNIVKWEGNSTFLSYTWRSKKFVLPKPENFSAAIVQAASYPVTARFYADGTLRHTQAVANANAFRLPSGFLAKTWEFQLEGTSEVYEMHIASSVDELRRV